MGIQKVVIYDGEIYRALKSILEENIPNLDYYIDIEVFKDTTLGLDDVFSCNGFVKVKFTQVEDVKRVLANELNLHTTTSHTGNGTKLMISFRLPTLIDLVWKSAPILLTSKVTTESIHRREKRIILSCEF